MRLLFAILLGAAALAGQGLRDWTEPGPTAKPTAILRRVAQPDVFDLSVISATLFRQRPMRRSIAM